jgi:peptidyl-prolyl cis-trans isomerase C
MSSWAQVFRGLLAFGFALALGTGCARKTKAAPESGVVAWVNGEPIERAQFEHELPRTAEGEPLSAEQLAPVKRALLDTLIDRALLLQAAQARGILPTQEEVNRRMLRLSSDYSGSEFDEALTREQLTAAELKQKTAALLTIEKLFQEHVYPRIGVTEAELRAYFSEHAREFQQPEEVRAAQIVVADLTEAKRLQAQLKAGKHFADLAQKYSLSPDAKVGGDLGYFPRGVMPPQFDEVAFRLGIDQISEVVPTEYGFHLFKVLDKRPARTRNFAEARQEVEQRLVKEKRTQAEKDFIAELRKKAVLKVNEGK